MSKFTSWFVAVLVACAVVVPRAHATRIQELCDVKGVRPNQLIGYGLVVGLAGTGDSGQARFTVQSTAAMLRRLGATIDPSAIQTKNAAAVMVTATLPAFANPGLRVDVVVSSLGNAKSLEGATLLQTPLLGADRRVYAVAQGPLLVGGFSAEGSGSSVKLNHTTVGRVPQGAIVERPAPTPALNDRGIVLNLREPSFVTAHRIAERINEELGMQVATAVDSGTVQVMRPKDFAGDQVGMLAQVQLLDVEADSPVRIVIDERTGTVVLGSGVTIDAVAIAQGGLTVEIKRSRSVSQPRAFADGQTRTLTEAEVTANIGSGPINYVPRRANLSQVVQALNALGAKPRNLIAIFQALQTAGALHANIEVQ